jgi:uncharacterized protein
MKILAIADRPPRTSIKELMKDNQIDVIITLGDLTKFEINELESITNIPKLGVYGNHDSGMYFDPLGIQNIHLKAINIKGFTFGGFEGSIRYKSDPTAIMYTQEEASELLKDFPKVDILITHCPPYGVNDEIDDLAHQGFQALGDYVKKYSPRYLLHGHTYPTENNITTKLDNTEIIYVYQDKIIKII